MKLSYLAGLTTAIALNVMMLSTASANSGSWQFVGKNAEYELYIAPTTIKTIQRTQFAPKYQQAWFKFHIHTDLSKDGLRVGDYKLRYFQFDCAQQTLGLVKGIDYLQDGSIAKTEMPSNVEMKPIVPDSIGQGLSDAICLDKYNIPAPPL